jgi:hypothetical protein
VRISGRAFKNAEEFPAPPAAKSLTTSVIRSLYGTAAATRCWALTMREPAINSIARVIFLVAKTDLIRLRNMRSCPPAILV